MQMQNTHFVQNPLILSPPYYSTTQKTGSITLADIHIAVVATKNEWCITKKIVVTKVYNHKYQSTQYTFNVCSIVVVNQP